MKPHNIVTLANLMRHSYRASEELAGEEGFEPSLRDPESRVLPLDYSPVLVMTSDVTESKSRRFLEGVNDILPLILPQKTRKIGQLIQSQLSNPPYCLAPLCNLSIAYQVVLRYAPVLKYQAKELLPENGPPCHFVIKDTDNANETSPPPAPPTLRAFTPRSADETEVMMAPSTLPESVTEVAAC